MTIDSADASSQPSSLLADVFNIAPWLQAEARPQTTLRGGRTAALAALNAAEPLEYERSRNFLSGKVTHLSPYLRHGVLTLAEVRDALLNSVPAVSQAAKLINELAWRDYWQRVYNRIGDAIWKDLESYKTGLAASAYTPELPADISSATTGLACIDGFSSELTQTGYLHNHVRMWLAAYIVHWRRVRWQAGARWFLSHLLDGDPASNNLSWQWVASTFAVKPYIFNRENLERYSHSAYCKQCPHARDRSCPFEATYEDLAVRLFKDPEPIPQQNHPALRILNGAGGLDRNNRPLKQLIVQPLGKALLWIHSDSLNPMLLETHKDKSSSAAFIWETDWLRRNNISLKRVVFLAECLRSFPSSLSIRVGPPAHELLALAQSSGATYLLAVRTPDPHLLAIAAAIEVSLPIVWLDLSPFLPLADSEQQDGLDLRRFSRYWQATKHLAMRPTATSSQGSYLGNP